MTNIKFRAYWEGEMRQVLVIDWLNELVDLEGGYIEIPFQHIGLMQYIGTDDANNDMYEQDIVDYTHLTYAGHGDTKEETNRVVLESVFDLPFIGAGADISCYVIGNTEEGVRNKRGENE